MTNDLSDEERFIGVDCSLTDEIADVIDRFEVQLLRYVGAIVRDRDTAQDIVQDAFIRYLEYRRDGHDVNHVGAWLYRVVHNIAIDYQRRNKRINTIHTELIPLQDAYAPHRPDQLLSRKDAAVAALQSLEVLNVREQQIVRLKLLEEKSYKEIAALMGLSTSNIGFILHTAMKRLAAELESRLA